MNASATSETVDNLIRRIAFEHGLLREAVEAMPDERWESQLPAGWSVKEMIASVAFWEETCAPLVAQFRGEAEMPAAAWYGGDDLNVSGEWPRADVHNAREAAWARARIPAEVTARWDRAHERVVAVARSLSEDDQRDQRIIDKIETCAVRHIQEHAAELQQLPHTRLSLLLAQFVSARNIVVRRLHGELAGGAWPGAPAPLTDEEHFWEPAPGCWSVRRREESVTAHPMGRGEWVLDFAFPEPVPPPVTTIAYRLGHLTSGLAGRHDWTFGSKSMGLQDLEFPSSAGEAVAAFETAAESWRAGLAGLSDRDLDTVGLSTFPGGLDGRLPFGEIVWWVNRELIVHGGEIALLRDLWRSRATPPGPRGA